MHVPTNPLKSLRLSDCINATYPCVCVKLKILFNENGFMQTKLLRDVNILTLRRDKVRVLTNSWHYKTAYVAYQMIDSKVASGYLKR